MNESQKEKTSFARKAWSAIKSAFRWVRRAAAGTGKAAGKATVWTAKKGLRLVTGAVLVVVSVVVTVAGVIVVALLSIGVAIGAQLGIFLWWVATGMKESYKDFSDEVVEAIAVYFQTYSNAMNDPEFVKFAEDAYDTMTNLDPDLTPEDVFDAPGTMYYVSAMDTPGDPDTIYAYGVFTSHGKAWDFHREMSRREKFVTHQEATMDLLGEEEDYDQWIFVHDGEYVSFERLGYQEAKSVDFSQTDDDEALKAYRLYESKAMDAKDLDAVNYWRGRAYARTNPERAMTPTGVKLCQAGIYAQTKDEYRKDASAQGIETEIKILNTRRPTLVR
jgi:hypothetical protein